MHAPAHSPVTRGARRGRPAIALALTAILAMTAPAPALADYGPGAEVASANGPLLGDADSLSPSISDDGRYVVFPTQAVNLLGSPPPPPGSTNPPEAYAAGIVRRDMVTGTVELVAPPRRVKRSDNTVVSPGATGPASISGNGRYVLFETSDDLPSAAGDRNASSDVYVRDMSRPLTDPGAYELVSSLDGTLSPATYDSAEVVRGSRAGRLGFGISDDGRRAAFYTAGRSNLPAGGLVATPRAQVFVRLLDSDRTLLVTRAAGDASASGTPVARDGAQFSPDPVLSGNGSSVAWVDTNPGAQTRLLPGEPVPGAAFLWRDINAGPAAPTRRVAGTSDPDDPNCPAGATLPSTGGEAATGACFGPFAAAEAITVEGSVLSGLSISDDGLRVLFLTNAHQRPFDERTAGTIAYLADMAPGLTRKQGVRRVLRQLGANPSEVILAGSGTRFAFAAIGRTFEGPRALGAFPTGETPTTNAFVVDLAQGTVQRSTVGADGTDYRGETPDPLSGTPVDPGLRGLALSDDAGAVAFAAQDGNLFVGDANFGALDVQVVRGAPGVTIPRSAFPAPDAPSVTPPGGGEASRPLQPLAPTKPVIGYLTVDRRGVARLTVRVPAAGRLTATASAAARGRRLRGKRMRVARTSRKLKRATTVHLRLRPTSAARTAARRAALRVRIDVRYTPTAGRSTAAVRTYTLTRNAAR